MGIASTAITDVFQPVVEAVIVNHNTSRFAELCMRSLLATNDLRGLRVTVADNHSSDEGAEELREAASDLGATFVRTRWPAADATTNTHGDVLRDFVLGRREADCYLFVDADIVFVEADTVATMLDELRASSDLWAVQARYVSPERRQPGASLDMGAGDPQLVDAGFSGTHWRWTTLGSGQRRVHPGCTLIANSPPFLVAARDLGFGTFVGLSQDDRVAGYYDTMALATAVMRTHRLRYQLSTASVVHYFNVSYDDRTDLTKAKLMDAQRRLAALRKDPGAAPAPGPWG